MANVKCVVNHPKLYLSANGKLQHVPRGTVVTLSQEQAARMAGKVSEAPKAKEVVSGDAKSEAKEK